MIFDGEVWSKKNVLKLIAFVFGIVEERIFQSVSRVF